MEENNKYNKIINAIINYYNVTKPCAVYLYFRRRRSYPWYTKHNNKYLYWNARLQNALLEADNIEGINWNTLQFGEEEDFLKIYNIDMASMSSDLFRKDNIVEQDGWTTVSYGKTRHMEENLLRSAGLLPKKK